MAVPTLREALSNVAFPALAVERFLDPDFPSWAKHDAELGYRLSPVVVRDGMDGSSSLYTYETSGARRIMHYRDRPCRLNTYGDSFTMCHQVSDGETWQEALSAHFGEPIRNFGVGGYGVYQAYRRMKRVEATGDSSPYVILNLYDDDHCRNPMACRWIHTRWYYPMACDGVMFHSTPWVHVRFDVATGKWIECDNLFPTEESLYRLCDAEFMYETFRHDPWLRLELLQEGGDVEETEDLRELARCFDLELDLSTPESSRRTAAALYRKYALSSTKFVVDLARQFCSREGKQLMFLLSYSPASVIAALRGEPRFDLELLEYLQDTGLPVVDALASHVQDFKDFSLSPEDYCNRYFVGHYSPLGNQFFAFAIKNALLGWLDPKPLTYAPGEVSVAEFVAKLA